MKWAFDGVTFLIDDLMRLMPGFSFEFQPGSVLFPLFVCFVCSNELNVSSKAMAYLGGRTFEMEGLGVLSRLAVSRLRSVVLSNSALSDPDDGHQRMLMILSVSLSSGKTIDLFNTHMSLSSKARLRNAREILREMNVDNSDRAQIFCGDLNAEPEDEVMSVFWSVLSDVGNCGMTFQAWNATKRIDYVMSRELEKAQLRVKQATLFGNSPKMESSASDHLGLRVEFAHIVEKRDEL
jgi:endonuclease/exonuclease/phosphatase family metal-dependent hydrolase